MIGGVVVGLWLVVVAYLVVSAALSMGHGASALRDVRRQATVSDLLHPGTRANVAKARSDFGHAASRLDNPLLAPIRILPVASRHLAAAKHLAHGSRDGAAVADTALRDLQGLVDRPHATGSQRIALLRDLASVASRAKEGLDGIDVGTAHALASSLGDKVTELQSQRDDAIQGASRLSAVSTALADVLDGPEPYLLLGANNAEMRADQGMFLSASTLSLSGGTIRLGPVQPTAEIFLPKGSVPVTGDLARNWSWLDPGRDLRNLGLTADLPQSAKLAVANWAKVPGGAKTAGVIVVDVDAIRSLLRVVGPVTVDGVRYTADNVRGRLLREQYQAFGDRDVRRDQLGQVARVIFDQLQQGHWKVDVLATELADAVQGRHLMVWSTKAATERAWHEVDADGHLTERSLSVALLSRDGTKLDSWVKTRAELTSSDVDADHRRITVRYRITNTSPGTGPVYVVGPSVAGLAAGDHKGLLVVNVPGGSTDVRITGATPFLAGHDGPTEVVGGQVVVRKGRTVTVTVTATLPAGLTDVVLEPTARIPHTDWVVDGQAFGRDRRRTVSVGGG